MPSFIILLFLAGAAHFFLQLPLILVAVAALALWVLWKLKWIILGVLGIEMLLGD